MPQIGGRPPLPSVTSSRGWRKWNSLAASLWYLTSMASPDVIVIGAGIIGCAAAHALQSAGARVQVIDSRRVGLGASQASAGVLAPYIEGHRSSELRTLGRRSLDLYDDFIARVGEASGRTIPYGRDGTLEVAFEDDELTRFAGTADALHREGLDASFLDGDAVRSVEPTVSNAARGGLLIGIHGFVSVPDLTEALATAAVRSGAQFRLGARVAAIRESDGRPTVDTDAGSFAADQVVLAAGSWSGQIAVTPIASVPVKPIRGQLLHLTWQDTQPIRHVLWSSECYMVPWPNGRVLVGATVEDAGFDERATAAGVRDLLEAACALVPQLWQASFGHVRVGLRPASPDGLPLIGRSATMPGLLYATGHYRNGVLLAPLTAALVKNIVFDDGDDPSLAALSPSRFERIEV
jgi:glycine oxidase